MFKKIIVLTLFLAIFNAQSMGNLSKDYSPAEIDAAFERAPERVKNLVPFIQNPSLIKTGLRTAFLVGVSSIELSQLAQAIPHKAKRTSACMNEDELEMARIQGLDWDTIYVRTLKPGDHDQDTIIVWDGVDCLLDMQRNQQAEKSAVSLLQRLQKMSKNQFVICTLSNAEYFPLFFKRAILPHLISTDLEINSKLRTLLLTRKLTVAGVKMADYGPSIGFLADIPQRKGFTEQLLDHFVCVIAQVYHGRNCGNEKAVLQESHVIKAIALLQDNAKLVGIFPWAELNEWVDNQGVVRK